jgi:hypothetical protein
VIRDLGCGFKASYETRADGWFEVCFFRNGRRLISSAFKPEREEDALKVFTGTTRDQLMRSLRVVL